MLRRKLTTLTVLLVSGPMMLTACSNSSESTNSGSSGADGWSRDFEGTQLNVIAEATANSAILEGLLPDFEEKTGITVSLEQAPYDNLVQKAVLDFTTNKGNYDVLSIPYEYLGSFAEQKYITPIDDYLKEPPTALGDTFDEKDILPNLWEASSQWKDQRYGMPSNSAVMMMMYRQDLLENPDEAKGFQEKYGYELAPAETWDQYRDIAEWFSRKSGDPLAGETAEEPLYGVALAGKRHVSTVLEWMNYSWGYGGDIFDQDGNVAINQPANVEALEYEKGLTALRPQDSRQRPGTRSPRNFSRAPLRSRSHGVTLRERWKTTRHLRSSARWVTPASPSRRKARRTRPISVVGPTPSTMHRRTGKPGMSSWRGHCRSRCRWNSLRAADCPP